MCDKRTAWDIAELLESCSSALRAGDPVMSIASDLYCYSLELKELHAAHEVDSKDLAELKEQLKTSEAIGTEALEGKQGEINRMAVERNNLRAEIARLAKLQPHCINETAAPPAVPSNRTIDNAALVIVVKLRKEITRLRSIVERAGEKLREDDYHKLADYLNAASREVAVMNEPNYDNPECFQTFHECSEQKKWELFKQSQEASSEKDAEIKRLKIELARTVDPSIPVGEDGCELEDIEGDDRYDEAAQTAADRSTERLNRTLDAALTRLPGGENEAAEAAKDGEK